MVSYLGAALSVACPIATSVVCVVREVCCAICHGPGKNIVPVRLVAAPIYALTILVKSRSFGDVWIQMQFIDVCCNKFAARIVPRTVPDAVTSGNAALALSLSRKVSAPRAISNSRFRS